MAAGGFDVGFEQGCLCDFAVELGDFELVGLFVVAEQLRRFDCFFPVAVRLVDVEQESFQPEAMVMTASQEVEGLSSLVHQFPQVTFHIAALTAMGPKLTDLATRPNVRLYPGISPDKYEDLLSSCSIYLDCNQGEEVWSSSLHALENGQVLFGLKSTVHQEAYKNLSTITDTVEEMKQQLDTLLQQPETYKELVREQARILKLPEKEALEELFKRLEGGTA